MFPLEFESLGAVASVLSTVLHLQAMNSVSRELREHSQDRSGRMHCFRGGSEFALKTEMELLVALLPGECLGLSMPWHRFHGLGPPEPEGWYLKLKEHGF